MTQLSKTATCQPELQQCPCCDYFTLDQRGRYEICAVCFWEDEPLLDEVEPSSANHGLTLSEARVNFISVGACYPAMKKHVLPENRRVMFEHQPRPVMVPRTRLSS